MSTETLRAIFSTLCFQEACDLHLRLFDGRSDRETRGLLRKALALYNRQRAKDGAN